MSLTPLMIILFIVFIVFLVVGRGITMWYVGTDQIVKNQKKIIALLTEIANGVNPAGSAPETPIGQGPRPPIAHHPARRSS